MAFVIFLSFALQFYVPMEMITRRRKGKESKYENFVQVGVRTAIVTVAGKHFMKLILDQEGVETFA